ncbi:MAG: DUF6228 family protein [Planctomycetia bacterium]|jgi:hypothetical protein
MSSQFSIKSSRSDKELVFTNHEDDYVTVNLHGSEMSATQRVWCYADWCYQNLVNFLSHLSKQHHGWDSTLTWSSIESDFVLGFRCDSCGHVFVEIEMEQRFGAEEWQFKAEIQTELGQLPSIATNAARFFQCEPGEWNAL